MIAGVGKALDSAVSKTVAGLVQGSIGGGASMALDNLTAEFATQLGNQTGYDADKALQSALEGIPVGMAGHLGGLGANVVGRFLAIRILLVLKQQIHIYLVVLMI